MRLIHFLLCAILAALLWQTYILGHLRPIFLPMESKQRLTIHFP